MNTDYREHKLSRQANRSVLIKEKEEVKRKEESNVKKEIRMKKTIEGSTF